MASLKLQNGYVILGIIIGSNESQWHSTMHDGLINSSPVVNIPPIIQLQHGCSHTIKIPGNNIIIVIACNTYAEDG